jgi:tetratricopeptide (TPR) repeat protein
MKRCMFLFSFILILCIGFCAFAEEGDTISTRAQQIAQQDMQLYQEMYNFLAPINKEAKKLKDPTPYYKEKLSQLLQIHKDYKDSLNYVPGNALVWAAWIYVRMGEYEKAQQCYNWVLEHYRSDAFIDSLANKDHGAPESWSVDFTNKYYRARAFYIADLHKPVLEYYLGNYKTAKTGFEYLLEKYEGKIFDPWFYPGTIDIYLPLEDYKKFNIIEGRVWGYPVKKSAIDHLNRYHKYGPIQLVCRVMIELIDTKMKEEGK